MVPVHRYGARLKDLRFFVVAIVVVGAIGTWLLLASHALTPTATIESEKGTASSCASKVTDVSASGGQAVRFTDCNSGSDTSLGLDASGATIPDTDYAIPAGAIFMATNGNDSSAGTQASPVKTLVRAIALVPSGGTVVVRGGTYRDGSTASINKKFTLQAYPHEQVWFDGTNVVTAWTSNGSGQWYTTWSTPSFCAGNYYTVAYNQQSKTGPCAYYDEYGDASYPAAADPQMVFKDGTAVHETVCPGTISSLPANDFCYQEDLAGKTGRIYLGFSPTGHTIELAARPSALVFQGGGGGNVVRGIGFKRFASNEFGGNSTGAGVLINEPNVTVEHCVFKQMASNGLSFANGMGGVAKGDVFVSNGANGIIGNGHQHSTGATDNLDIENSIFNGNNAEHFGSGCSYSCSAAGMKVSHMDGFTLKNNIFENGIGVAKGFWCDLACSDGVMVQNVFRNNGGAGLMYEVGNTGIIASNLIYGNGAEGLKMGSANTKIYNNTIVNNAVNVLIYDDQRSYGVNGWTDVGPDTANVTFFNNVIYGSNIMVRAINAGGTMPPNTGPDTFYTGLDYDSYYRTGGSSQVLYYWKQTSSNYKNYTSLASLTADHGWEAHGHDVVGSSNPFVNLSGGDYHVAAGSAEYHTGRALPSDVAAALGLSTSTTMSRGAVTWPTE